MTIYRDIRDVIASSKRLKVLNIQRQITGYVSEFAAWTSVPDILVSRYEDIVDNIPLEVQRIRNHMGVYTSPERLQKISWKYERDNMKTLQTQGLNKEGYSKKHHLWSNHVGSGKVGRWRDELTHDEAQEVAHLVGGWLKKHGYN
jgi:UDP-galactopyranose mutase